MNKIIRTYLLTFVAAYFAVGVVSLQAQGSCGPNPAGNPGSGDPPSCGSGPATQSPSEEPSVGAGNPINLISGNKYQRETDLAALPGELGVEVVRHYNSSATFETGHVGRGWRLSYETELRFEAGLIKLIQADGSSLSFKCLKLICKTADWADGMLKIEELAGGLRSYRWRWLAGEDAGRELLFDARGLLMSITATSGATLRVNRRLDGRLQEVIDPQGRKLVFHYPNAASLTHQAAKFDGVMMIDTPIGQIVYQHGSPVPDGIVDEKTVMLGDKTLAAGYVMRQSNLVSVQLGTVVRKYHYESVFEGQYAHLTGISLLGNRLSTYLYDASGLAVLSTRGAPARLMTDKVGAAVMPRIFADGTGIEQVHLTRKRQGETVLTNSLGLETVYTHKVIAGKHRLLQVRGPGCSSCGDTNVRYSYDANARLVSTTKLDETGKPISVALLKRDLEGRVVERQMDGLLLAKYAFEVVASDGVPNLNAWKISRPSVVQGQLVVSTIERNKRGQIEAIMTKGWRPTINGADPIESRLQNTYADRDSQSLLVAQRTAKEAIEIVWDAQGRYVETIRPERGSQVRFLYDEAGRIVESRQSSGARSIVFKTRFEGNQVKERTVSAWLLKDGQRDEASVIHQRQMIYSYDAAARLIETRDAADRVKRFGYDAIGRLNLEGDAQGYSGRVLFDTESRVQRSAAFKGDELVRATYAWHDDYGRVTRRLVPDGRMDEWVFDKAGNVAQHFSGDDVLHSVLRAKGKYGLGDPALQVSQSGDGNVRLAFQTGQTGEVRDDFDRLVMRALPDHGISRFTVDVAGRVTSKTDALGNLEQYAYNLSGQLVGTKFSDASGEVKDESAFTFDGDVLGSVSNRYQTTVFERDALGRIVKERVRMLQMAGAKEFVTETRFHPTTAQVVNKKLFDGQVLRTVHADAKRGSYAQRISIEPAWVASLHVGAKRWLGGWLGGWFGSWSRDMLPSTVLVADVKVDPLNGLASFKFGNGLDYRKTFDLAGRVVAINQAGVADRTYGFDVGPRIRSINFGGAKDGVIKTSFDYAGFGHLIVASPAFPALPALPLTTPKVVPSLDAAGRIIQDQRFGYRYTTTGQLQEVKTLNADSTLAKYTFNARQQRVSKEVLSADGKSATRYFLWQGDNIAAEVNEAGKIVTQYVYLNDGAKAMPVAKIGTDVDAKKVLFIHSEHRAAPIAMTGADRKIVWQADLSEAGIAKVASNALDKMEELNLRLPGQYFDAETGLHDNFHRTYDSATGRYLQPDPLGYPDGPDPYLYASGDPVNRIDPKGLYDIDVHYYMTYFLARVAGVGAQQAYTIALASQYIDDNPDTWPLNPNRPRYNFLNPNAYQRLSRYHFTQAGFDPIANSNEQTTTPGYWFIGPFGPSYAASTVSYSQSYIERRILDPMARNVQLGNLRDAVNRAPTRCSQAQFMGEFLHAFADSFGHRDQNNEPIQINGNAGHLLYGHEPDKTYNDVVTRSENLLFASSTGNWNQREARTLQMEREAHGQLTQFSRGSGSQGNAVAFQNLETFLRSWNQQRDGATKIFMLDEKLQELGFGPLPAYDRICAAAKRAEYLRGIPTRAYTGVIFPQSSPRGSGQPGSANQVCGA
jgi:RHS repeat-associated protein